MDHKSLKRIEKTESGKVRFVMVENIEMRIIDYINKAILTKGYFYHEEQVVNYYLSLKTKPFIIMTGISGTGKTKLSQLFLEAIFGKDSGHYRLIPVRPDWNDDKYLLGYYNPLTFEYQKTPFLEYVFRALQNYNYYLECEKPNVLKPFFVCLDEMNLARVEYYFSTFLSAMESGEPIELMSEATLQRANKEKQKLSNHENAGTKGNATVLEEWQRKFHIPPNLFFIGTVNIDETTYQFSPKVLDRANTIEFIEVNLSHTWTQPQESENENIITNEEMIREFTRSFLFDQGKMIDKRNYLKALNGSRLWNETTEYLERLNSDLVKHNLHIGYRVRDEIMLYLAFNEASGLLAPKDALDLQTYQKILPKIKGGDEIRDDINSVLETMRQRLTEESKSYKKLASMIKKLDNGLYCSFF
jgi:energy-coupling factor transporter ATP-binding protein EcfA2